MTAGFLDGYLPYLLRQADQTLSEPFYAVLTRYGVARSEWRVLAVLHELGDLGVVELAAASLSPQPTVTHALRRLEDRDLVTRRPGDRDKRQRIISITPSGAQLTTGLIDEATALEHDALADVDDLAALSQQLRDLTAAIEAQAQTIQIKTQAG
ncbi:MAG: MarR family transcriptional regulator [Acidimicrobiales bacterium]|nr:MarR family transcriptional regulator [Acidimicrobiales bacterium]MDG1875851.1 MarR family transcriptional regulator [Acidimicrobiales bacterium]